MVENGIFLKSEALIPCSVWEDSNVSEQYAASVFKIEVCRFRSRLACLGKLKEGGYGTGEEEVKRVTLSEPVGRHWQRTALKSKSKAIPVTDRGGL
jgi:hypothetical protein